MVHGAGHQVEISDPYDALQRGTPTRSRMTAPGPDHGFERAIAEFLTPSVLTVGLSVIVLEFGGGFEARVVFIGLTVLSLLSVVDVATHWNRNYTGGFAIGGIFFAVFAPGVAGVLFDPLTAGVVVLVEVSIIAAIISQKFGRRSRY